MTLDADDSEPRARATELRWRWRMLVLDMLYHLVVVQTGNQTAQSRFARPIDALRRDLGLAPYFPYLRDGAP